VNPLPAALSGSAAPTSMAIQGEATPGRAAYLDLQATTPLDPRVLDAMMPFYTHAFGNPHSRTHTYGWEAEQVVEKARKQVADLIGADPKEIIFTSGATESNNLAIKGVARFLKGQGKTHVITTAIEHKCVLDSCRWLEQEGYTVTYLPVQTNGLLDLGLLEKSIRPGETALVSVMGVNNEIGVLQPLKEIGAICRKHKVYLHTDAAQMVGKVPMSVDDLNIDLMSISGHKVYGPKGIGALYVRRKPRVRLEAQISGGGQERGLRSGTLPHPLIAGLGAACEIASREMASDTAWVTHLSKRLHEGIVKRVPHTILNGDATARYPGNLNISFAYVEGESLLMALKNLAVSSGSACTSASLEPSYGERGGREREERRAPSHPPHHHLTATPPPSPPFPPPRPSQCCAPLASRRTSRTRRSASASDASPPRQRSTSPSTSARATWRGSGR
jgi:cysteine desulfurase